MIKSSSIILIFITLTVWLIYLFPKEALSPGDLLEKHSQLEESCLSCHQTFLGPSGTKCVKCHTPEKIGVFKVNSQIISQGKKELSFHTRLGADSCISCHKEHQDRFASSQTIQFSHEMLGIKDAKNCVECHQRPMTSIHQQVGQDCAQCHKTTNWASTEIDHSGYFKFDRDHQADCTTCHTSSNYKEYTCYGCHEHSERKIKRKHVKEGIRDYENCADCHRSGDEHDIRKTRRVKNLGLESRNRKIKRRDKKSKRSSDHNLKQKKHSKDGDDDHEDDDHHDDDDDDDDDDDEKDDH